jgi:hypothetical protein
LKAAGFRWYPTAAVTHASNQHQEEVWKQEKANAIATKNRSFWLNMVPAALCLLACLLTFVWFVKTRSYTMGFTSLATFGTTLLFTGNFVRDTNPIRKA